MKKDVTKTLAILTASAIGLSLSGCSSQVDSVDQFFDNKSYEEGLAAFREAKKWEPEDLSALAGRMRENIDKEIDLYAKDLTDYTNVDSLLRSISELHISEIDEDLLNAKTLLAALKTSKEHYTNAEKEFAERYYTNAIYLYQCVIEEDSHYEDAQTRINECAEAYVSNCKKNAESKAADGYYGEAYSTLVDGLSDIDRFDAFTEEQRKTIQEQLDSVVFESVQKLADEKDYDNAFRKLSGYAPSVSDVNKVAEFGEKLAKAYVDNCLKTVEDKKEDGLYVEAYNVLLSGLSDIDRFDAFTEEHRKTIQEQLDSVVFESVQKLADEKDYDNAFQTLSVYAPSVSDANKVAEFGEALQAEYESFLYDEAKEECLLQADESAKNDMYAGALNILDQFVAEYAAENDSDIMVKHKEYEEKYVDRMLAVGTEFYQDGKLLRAYRFIQDCNNFVHSERFDSALNEIGSVKPLYLSELKCQTAEHYEEVTTGDIIVDTLGNEYHPEDLNLFEIEGYNDGWTGEIGYAEYYLGYQYNRLVGTVAVDDKSGQDVYYTLTIEGDGVVLFSQQLDRKTVPTPVDIDVKGVQYLKFNLSEHDGEGHVYGILSDFHFEE